MKKEDIIFLPHASLREKSEKVQTVDEETLKLIDDMIGAATDWEDSRPHEISAALAAVQIDRLKRVLIIRGDFDDKNTREFIALINPKIIKYEGQINKDYEGCLSVKDIYGMVPRHSKIRIRALNVNGQEIQMKVSGFPARVLQHEIDHMEGKLFIDHIKHEENAFYTLDDDGELRPLDYENNIKNNSVLWDGDEDDR